MDSEKTVHLVQKLVDWRAEQRRKFGQRLKEERKRLGLSLVEFSRRLNIHRNTQSNYEAGDREPDETYLIAAAKLGVSLTFLENAGRFEDMPSAAARIAERIFKKADTALNHEVMAQLFYLFGLNDVHENSGLTQSFSEAQETALIQAAFQDGEAFWEAAEAIAKYAPRLGKHPFGEEPAPRLRAELILETLRLYALVKDRPQISLRDTIRLIADDLIDARGSARQPFNG